MSVNVLEQNMLRASNIKEQCTVLLFVIQSHKPLSERMKSKFREWHQAWADSNLSEQQIEFAGQWMLGNLPDYRVNQTRVLTDNPLDKAPYHPYNRYRVTYK